VFRDFLKRLIAGMERKIFLIVDGHPAHKARLVSRFVLFSITIARFVMSMSASICQMHCVSGRLG
jgi:hypothetical protein